MREILSGWMSGDMAVMSAVWLVLLPFAAVGAFIKWMRETFKDVDR